VAVAVAIIQPSSELSSINHEPLRWSWTRALANPKLMSWAIDPPPYHKDTTWCSRSHFLPTHSLYSCASVHALQCLPNHSFQTKHILSNIVLYIQTISGKFWWRNKI
jgi:hypothetical protein